MFLNNAQKIIQRLAVKARLTIRCFEARKEDKEASEKTTADHGAKKGVASVRKSIISREALKPLTDIRSAARNYHREMTSPWGEGNERILNAVLVQEYKTQMRRFEQEYVMAFNVFKSQYPLIIAREAANLGAMYKITDYPSANELDDKFEFVSQITPIECADDFRVNIAESVLDEIKKEIVEQEKANQANITRDLYDRLHFVINDMVERLSAKNVDPQTSQVQYKRFSRTAIDNIKRLIEILPRLNINQDPDLFALRDEVAQKFQDLTADDIRENDHLRAKTVADGEKLLKEIENRMGGLYGLPEEDQEAA